MDKQPTTEDLARRLDELAGMIITGNLDRPPADVVLRTLLRYIYTHGGVSGPAKLLAASFEKLLADGSAHIVGPYKGNQNENL